MIIGICCPDGDRGLTVGAARLDLGMYGVYVVCGCVDGCFGGGGRGPERVGGGSGLKPAVVEVDVAIDEVERLDNAEMRL